MQLQQLSQRHALERSKALGMPVVKKLLGLFGREALNHPLSVLRCTLYVKRIRSFAERKLKLPPRFRRASASAGFNVALRPSGRHAGHPEAPRRRTPLNLFFASSARDDRKIVFSSALCCLRSLSLSLLFAVLDFGIVRWNEPSAKFVSMT